MKSIKPTRINGVLVPFSLPARKKYPFRTAIPPCSVVVVNKSRGSLCRGQSFRAGYYSWRDGLDCIWLVNDAGKYLQTIDHDFLQKHFEVASKCTERSVCGRNGAKLLPIP
jgi:hypothetical protein